jgi:hypothetical protein
MFLIGINRSLVTNEERSAFLSATTKVNWKFLSPSVTAWERVHEKLAIVQLHLLRNPCTQQPATGLHLNPVHALSSYFFKIHFNIIFPYTPRNSKQYCSFPLLLQLRRTNFLSAPVVQHTKPISSSWSTVWTTEWHTWATGADFMTPVQCRRVLSKTEFGRNWADCNPTYISILADH